MPCNSDHLHPTAREQELQRAAQMYVFWCEEVTGSADQAARNAAADIYCRADYTARLCECIRIAKASNPDLFNRIVYNAYLPLSRRLADWWEEHEKADRARIEAEEAEERLQKEYGPK